MALAFKALRALRPDYALWRDFAYEYERDRLAIDLINGSELLRQWVDDPPASRPISTRLPAPMRTHGAKSGNRYCSTAKSAA